MWLITNFGFFSIVEKNSDIGSGMLTIRSRTKKDLESLRDKYLSDMEEILEGAGTDYKYRARVKRASLAQALSQITLDVDYDNFKNSVAAKQGSQRAKVYGGIWGLLYQLQDKEGQQRNNHSKGHHYQEEHDYSGKIASYGGVLFNPQGQVLIRQPTNEFDGYVWTFPKGRHDPKITPEETALKEVHEETGYKAKILSKIDGTFQGGTGMNEYFLMIAQEEPDQFDDNETAQVKWVAIEEAPIYINKTRNKVGRQRDLKVLKAALNEYKKYQMKVSQAQNNMITVVPPSASQGKHGLNVTILLSELIEYIERTNVHYQKNFWPNLIAHPIPFFGDPLKARIITVGVNPSATEFRPERGWPDHISLEELQTRLTHYFDLKDPYVPPHKWFDLWEECLQLLGCSYKTDAAHLDLSPRATISMSKVPDKSLFLEMLEKDIGWFFKFIELATSVKLVFISGAVTNEYYMYQFLRKNLPKGYRLDGKPKIEKGFKGIGWSGIFTLTSPDRRLPFVFYSKSPSAPNGHMLLSYIERLRESLLRLL